MQSQDLARGRKNLGTGAGDSVSQHRDVGLREESVGLGLSSMAEGL